MESTALLVTGLELRYILTLAIWDRARPVTVAELVELLKSGDYRLHGRPSKTVSDALRWEVRKGRVRRAGRGRYAPGRIPRSTLWWLRHRVDQFVAQTLALSKGTEVEAVVTG